MCACTQDCDTCAHVCMHVCLHTGDSCTRVCMHTCAPSGVYDTSARSCWALLHAQACVCLLECGISVHTRLVHVHIPVHSSGHVCTHTCDWCANTSGTCVCTCDAEQLTVVLSPVQAPSESLGAVGGLFSPSRVQWSQLCPPPLHMHQEGGQAGCCEPPGASPVSPQKAAMRPLREGWGWCPPLWQPCGGVGALSPCIFY